MTDSPMPSGLRRATLCALVWTAAIGVGCEPSAPPMKPMSSSQSPPPFPPTAPAPIGPGLQGTLVTYKNGVEVGRERYHDDGVTLSSELTLPGKAIVVKLPHAPGKLELECDGEKLQRVVPDGAIALENGSWQAYAIAAKRFPSATAPTPVQVLVPCLGKTVPATISVNPIPGGGTRVEVALGPLTVTADVAPSGAVTRAAVPLQGIEVRVSGEAPPVVAERPAPEGVTEQPFETTSSGVMLRGALWLPVKPGAKLPVVVFIAGSGPTDRDGNSALGLKSDVYRMLAEALARRQVASLRYDKRGTGRSGFDFSEADLTIETFVDDAAAVLAKLREGGRFSSIIVAGHSEGALIGTMLAAKTPIDGLVLLAGGGRPFAAILREQLARKVDAKTMTDVDRLLDALRTGKPLDPVPPHLEPLFRAPIRRFLKSELALDPAALLKPLKVPTVIIQGESDAQITPGDARLLAAARPDAKLVLLPKASHVFKDEASTALPQKSYTDPTLPLSAGVVEAMLSVIKK